MEKAKAQDRGKDGEQSAVSVHRAFFYAAGAPGYGEYYAGARLRGAVTAAVLCLFLCLFTWSLWKIVGLGMAKLADSFDGLSVSKPVSGEPPYALFVLSVLGLYITWLWGMMASVGLAVEKRERQGGKPQRSVPWGVIMSWLCPGAGQLYAGEAYWGYCLFVAYLLSFFLLIPAWSTASGEMSALFGGGKLNSQNMLTALPLVQACLAKVYFSFGQIFQYLVKLFAIMETVSLLCAGSPGGEGSGGNSAFPEKPGFSLQRLFGLGLLGYLCPGAAQVLENRVNLGWIFFSVYVACQILIALFLGIGAISAASVETWTWLPSIALYAAVAEAPLRLLPAVSSGEE